MWDNAAWDKAAKMLRSSRLIGGGAGNGPGRRLDKGNRMRLRIGLATLLGLLAIGGMAFAQADVIAQRRAGLKRMGEHMESMKAIIDQRGDPKQAVARVDDMTVWYRGLPALFPPGSGTGDTKARPEIWQDFARFEQLNTALLGQLATLRTAAASGDAAAFAAAYQATGPQFCGACHRPFRAR